MENQSVIHLAIADDHTLYLEGLSEIISTQKDFVVEIKAKDGKDLLCKLSESKNLPDICLLDVRMPGMNGYETLLELQKKWPQIKVLVISMHKHENVVINMLRNGASGYLLKDATPAELFSAIRSVYQKGVYHTDLVPTYFTKANEVPKLTSTEYTFLCLCCEELSYKDIADKMRVNPRTVESYRETLFSKLKVQTRTGLVMFAIRNGLIS